jgi:hypothetical protein
MQSFYRQASPYSHLCEKNTFIHIENIEALADGENAGRLDTSYSRIVKNCEFRAAANGLVTIFGLTLKANADGYVSIPEQVTCQAGGNQTCQSIECIDLIKNINAGSN